MSKDVIGATVERPASGFQLDSTEPKAGEGMFLTSAFDVNVGGKEVKRMTKGLKIMVLLDSTHISYRNGCANVARFMFKHFHFTVTLKKNGRSPLTFS